jgi:hypothetical protein
MKKVFICLFLMCLFLGSNVVNAVAEDEGNCRLYLATITIVDDEGYLFDQYQDCIGVCIYNDGWAEAGTFCDGDYLVLALEDLGSDFKNLVGPCYNCEYDKVCHASLRGKNLEADCLVDIGDGYRVQARGLEITNENLCPCNEPET